MTPDAQRLSAREAQILLYALGYRTAFGFLPADPPDRMQTAAALAALAHRGVLVPEADALRLAEPWRTWMNCWGSAPGCVSLWAAGGRRASCHAGCGGVLVCAPLYRSPETMLLRWGDAASAWDAALEELGGLPACPALAGEALLRAEWLGDSGADRALEIQAGPEGPVLMSGEQRRADWNAAARTLVKEWLEGAV